MVLNWKIVTLLVERIKFFGLYVWRKEWIDHLQLWHDMSTRLLIKSDDIKQRWKNQVHFGAVSHERLLLCELGDQATSWNVSFYLFFYFNIYLSCLQLVLSSLTHFLLCLSSFGYLNFFLFYLFIVLFSVSSLSFVWCHFFF